MFDGSEHFYPAFRAAVMPLAALKGGLVLDLGTPRPPVRGGLPVWTSEARR